MMSKGSRAECCYGCVGGGWGGKDVFMGACWHDFVCLPESCLPHSWSAWLQALLLIFLSVPNYALLNLLCPLTQTPVFTLVTKGKGRGGEWWRGVGKMRVECKQWSDGADGSPGSWNRRFGVPTFKWCEWLLTSEALVGPWQWNGNPTACCLIWTGCTRAFCSFWIRSPRDAVLWDGPKTLPIN